MIDRKHVNRQKNRPTDKKTKDIKTEQQKDKDNNRKYNKSRLVDKKDRRN